MKTLRIKVNQTILGKRSLEKVNEAAMLDENGSSKSYKKGGKNS